MEWLVPANLLLGREASESAGCGDALGDSVATSLGGGVDFTPPPTPGGITGGSINHLSVGYYASDASGDTADDQPAASLAAVDYARNAGAGLVISRNGQQVRLADCGSAWPTAAGTFWIDPADVGIGPGQIPADPTQLTAAALAGHPAVFVRGPQSVHGLQSQQGDAGLKALNLPIPLTPVVVYTVDAAPVGSRWCICMDGQAFRVDVQHDPAANLRRPADIWNAIIVDGIERPRPNDLAMTQFVGSVPPFTWRTRGRFARLSYLQYARCVEMLWDGQPAITSLYAAPPVPP